MYFLYISTPVYHVLFTQGNLLLRNQRFPPHILTGSFIESIIIIHNLIHNHAYKISYSVFTNWPQEITFEIFYYPKKYSHKTFLRKNVIVVRLRYTSL